MTNDEHIQRELFKVFTELYLRAALARGVLEAEAKDNPGSAAALAHRHLCDAVGKADAWLTRAGGMVGIPFERPVVSGQLSVVKQGGDFGEGT